MNISTTLKRLLMEKLKRLPNNCVTKVEFQESPDYNYACYDYNNLRNYDQYIPIKTNAKIEITIEMNNDNSLNLLQDLKDKGLSAVTDNSFNVEAFRYVINEGFIKLPTLFKHPNPDISQIAFILSKYFASRNEIMPEQIIE